MSRLVIIAHPSAIIRKGLVSILENKIAANTICVAQFPELKESQYLTYTELVLFLPSDFNAFDLLTPLKVKVYKNKIIGLSHNSSEIIKNQHQFDYTLSINSSSEKFVELVVNCFSEEVKEKSDDELTNREKEVLRLIALGFTNKSIADTLFISTHTVISHRKNITEKLGIKTIPGLTVYAIIQNIVNPSDITPDQLL